MKMIVWHSPARTMLFVAERVGEKCFHDYSAIGLEENGRLIAGVVYTNHTGEDGNVMMHVASDGSRRWMTPAYLAACFRYPFLQLKCRRITGLVRVDNKLAQRFDEHLGFKREGLMRQGCTDGTDMIVYGMLKDECRFLGEKHRDALLRAS